MKRSLLFLLGRILLGASLLSGALSAANIDPAVARDKKLLYVIHIYPNNGADEIRRLQGQTPVREDRIKEIKDYMSDHPKMLEHLKSLGFVVTVTDEFSPLELATQSDLVLISEQVGASELNQKYKDLAVPCIVMENDIYDDMNLTGKKIDVDYGEIMETDRKHAPERYIWLVNAPHPLSAGLPAGILNYLDSKEHMNWGVPGPGAIMVATIPGYLNKGTIFAYEKGATMDAEHLAPARRVGFALRTLTGLHKEGVALFDAALLWAVSPPGSN
ncbi:MAG: putative lipoprotein transrane [Verrucomicrobia bacterium]|nr:putative lipoprotein transrane [Verrucomicrobiota bacterium]